MEISKEGRVWIKQGENRKKSCLVQIKTLKNQINILKKGIELEKEQIKLIEKEINDYKKTWKQE